MNLCLVPLLEVPIVAIRFAPILSGLVITLFVLAALLLTFVILIQEGKGGGIAGAFGGAAAESFGVKAGSVNRFTAWLATIFIGLAVVHGAISAYASQSVLGPETPRPAPVTPAPGMGDDAPAMDGEPPPAMDAPPAMTDGTTPPAMDGTTPPPTPPSTPPPPTPPPAPAMEPETPPAPGMQ